jgi:NADPH-dependent 2,4-dienoyl-CoA reductase/sulfur reductase-like enzyme
VIDESPRPGGQAYRQPPAELDLDIAALLGREYANYERLHAEFATAMPRIDYRPNTTAFDIGDNEVLTHSGGRLDGLQYDALLLATGAVDRVIPAKGWTLPGVYTLGAAQTLLKDQGALIGRRIVFVGSSPLLYLAALQCRKMGGEVVAILDTNPFSDKLRSLGKLLSSKRTLWQGVSYIARLRAAGVRIENGIKPVEIGGEGGVSRMSFRDSHGALQHVDCDAVALGYGLRSETQLAELAGCEFAYHEVFRQNFPKADADGRCGRGVYVAGDGALIGGAHAAELSGRLAAFAIMADQGRAARGNDAISSLRRRLGRLRRFQEGLASAFRLPFQGLADLGDEVTMCRCENVTAGELRDAVRRNFGAKEVNRVKAYTRCGMGRCQGRYCGIAAAEMTAMERGVARAEVGQLRVQAPIKPVPISAVFADRADVDHAH